MELFLVGKPDEVGSWNPIIYKFPGGDCRISSINSITILIMIEGRTQDVYPQDPGIS